MPNWCENVITIFLNENLDELPQDLLTSIFDDNDKLMFSTLLPAPEGTAEFRIQWCIENWGTKWETDDASYIIDKETGDLIIKCETASSPPLEFMKHLSSVFPDVTIEVKYLEFGMNFMGEETYISGILVSEKEPASITLERLLERGDYSEEDIINMGFELES